MNADFGIELRTDLVVKNMVEGFSFSGSKSRVNARQSEERRAEEERKASEKRRFKEELYLIKSPVSRLLGEAGKLLGQDDNGVRRVELNLLSKAALPTLELAWGNDETRNTVQAVKVGENQIALVGEGRLIVNLSGSKKEIEESVDKAISSPRTEKNTVKFHSDHGSNYYTGVDPWERAKDMNHRLPPLQSF